MKKSPAKRFIKIALVLFTIFLVAFNAGFYLIRRPDVQTYLTRKAAALLTSVTGAPASVGSVDLGFKMILLQEVFIGDLNHDTLLYIHRLKITPVVRSLLRRKLDVRSLQLDEAKLFIHRQPDSEEFNYEALFGKSAPHKDNKSSSGFHFRVPAAEINNLDFHYLDERNKNQYRVAFKEMHASRVNINSPEKYMLVDKLHLKGADIVVKKLFTSERHAAQVRKNTAPRMLNNAGWEVRAGNVRIENTAFSYVNENRLVSRGGMNYNDLHVADINVDLQNTSIICDTIRSKITGLSASEKCGFVLQNLTADATVSTTEIECRNMHLVTDNSVIKDYLRFSYEAFADFLDYVNKVKMHGDFKSSRVALKDINYFAQNALDKLAHNTVWLTGTVKGTVSNLKGRQLDLSLGKNTRFSGNFDFKGLPVFSETFITLNVNRLNTTTDDLRIIYPHIHYPANLEKLGRVNFTGSFNGFANDFVARGNLATAIGGLSSDINLKIDPATNHSRYSGNFAAHNFHVGKYISNENLLGEITFNARLKGKGLKLQNVDASVDGNIARFSVKQHDYIDVKVNGDLRKSFFKGLLAVRDENLDLDFEGTVDMTGTVPMFQFVSELRKANLKQLNLSESEISVASTLQIDFTGLTPDKFNGYAGIFNTRIEKNRQTYRLDTFELIAHPVGDGAKELVLNSDIAHARLTGRFAYEELPDALLDLVKYYLEPGNAQPVVHKEENFIFHLELKNTGNLTTLIDTAFKNISEGYVNFAFNNKGNRLYLNSLVSGITYGNFKANHLAMQSVSEEGVITFSARVDSLFHKDSLLLTPLRLQSRIENDSFRFTVAAQGDECPKRLRLNGLIETDFKSFTVRLTPSSLFLDGDEWTVSKNNKIYFDAQKVLTENLSFFNRKSELELAAYMDTAGRNHLTAFFRKIDLHDISKSLPGSAAIDLGGEINGSATVLDILKDPKLTASLTIDTFRINKHFIGNLAVASSYKPGGEHVEINVNLSGAENDLSASGFYYLKKTADNLDFSVDIRNLHLPHIEPFIQKEVSRIRGAVSGKLSVKGSTAEPLLKGTVTVTDAAARVNILNTTYSFDREEIAFSKNLIDLGDLHLQDDEGNTAYALGKISHSAFRDFYFDIDIKTSRMLFLNTAHAPGQPFYGRLLAGGLVLIKGPLNNIEFLISAKTKQGTNVYLDIVGSKDVSQYAFYRFVNTDGSQTAKSKYVSKIKGLTLNCNIEATPDANVNVILNYEEGDVINAKGAGNLNIVLNNMGDLSISGDYRITDGNYVFSMQNIISKRFSMEKGSSIRWSGDPANAILDITGLYKLRASPYDLLADFVTTEAEIQKAKNRVQVLLYLYITGSLARPDITFDIKVPDADPTIRTYLDSRFQELKYHQDEFNKQVVGLLVLNRFLPQKNSASESNVGSVVNTSVSEFISNQLSVYLSDWISEFITEVQLDINYRSYQTEGTAPVGSNGQIEFENRQELQLALTKTFFNDRISVDVGGDFDFGNAQSSTAPSDRQSNIAGDFEIEYSVTADGRIKIKAFRKGEYDIFQDRNKNKTGVGISYQKEFNSVKDFFTNIRKRRAEKKRKEEENKVKAAPHEPGN